MVEILAEGKVQFASPEAAIELAFRFAVKHCRSSQTARRT